MHNHERFKHLTTISTNTHTHTQQLSVSHSPISRPSPAEARAEQRSRPPAPAPTRTQRAIVSVCSCPGSMEASNKKDPKWCVTLAEGEGGAELFRCHICPHSGLVGWAAVVCMCILATEFGVPLGNAVLWQLWTSGHVPANGPFSPPSLPSLPSPLSLSHHFIHPPLSISHQRSVSTRESSTERSCVGHYGESIFWSVPITVFFSWTALGMAKVSCTTVEPPNKDCHLRDIYLKWYIPSILLYLSLHYTHWNNCVSTCVFSII